MLCHFGHTRNGSVAIHFILRGRAATSSATGDYVAVPERLGQNEEPAGSNDERTKKDVFFLPKVYINDAVLFQTCKHNYLNIFFYCILVNIDEFSSLSYHGKSFDLFVYTNF